MPAAVPLAPPPTISTSASLAHETARTADNNKITFLIKASIEEKVSIFVPAGIESGETVKIPKKGYKDGQGGRGDLIAEVKIAVPKELTDEEKALFEKLNEISKYNPRA